MLPRKPSRRKFAMRTFSLVKNATATHHHARTNENNLYRLFAQNMPGTAVVMFDNDLRYTLAEGTFFNRLSLVVAPIIGKRMQDCIKSKEVADYIIPVCQRALLGESFSYDREWLDYAYHAHVAPLKDGTGAIVGGMVLAHDITERKQLEAALLASEEQQRLITGNIQDVVTRIDREDRILYVSSSSTSVLGFAPEEIVGKSAQDFFHPDDWPLIDAAQRQSIEAGEHVMRGEARVRHADGHYIYAESTGKFLYDDQGGFVGGIYVTRDVSERKRLEVALRNSEEQLRLITDNVQDVITKSDADGRIIYANSSARTVLGFAPEELVGKPAREFLHPDDWAKLRDVQAETIKSGRQDLRGEGRMRHADGHYIHVETTVKLLWDEQRNFLGGIYVTRDISERKRLEMALRNSEEQLRLVTDNLRDMITHSDAEDRILYTSPSSRIVLGYEPEQMTGHFRYEFAHPDAWATVIATRKQAIQQHLSHAVMEVQLRHADGHYIEVETVARFLYDTDSNYIGGIFVARDITDRKSFEFALRESENLLRLITDNMQDMITCSDAQDRIIYTSPSCRLLLGCEPEDMTGHHAHEFVQPDVVNTMISVQQQITQQKLEEGSLETRLRHADGHYVDVETVARFLYDSHSNYIGGIFASRDITERKRLEASLRASEERLRLITDNMQDLVILVGQKEDIIYVSPSICTVMGYDPTTIVGTTPSDATHPDDRERVFQTISAALLAHRSYLTVEARLRHAAGHYKNFEVVCRLLYDDQAGYSGAVFVARDITERKRLEAALRASEESLRLITDNVQDLILLTNDKREAVYFSPSFIRVLGHDASSLYKTPPVNFIHPDDRARLGAEIQKLFSNEASQATMELRVAQPDGPYISYEDVFRPVNDADGGLTGILHVLRDITSRKQMEDLLLEKQKLQTALEKEQELSTLKTRMMERISHEFRTPLSIIQAAAETLIHYHHRLSDENRDAKNITVQNQIRRITDMLDEIALVLRSTRNANHFSRSRTNLTALCREIAAELSTSFALPGKYQLELQPDLMLSVDAAVLRDGITHIMRNAARFSAPAEPVIVHLVQTADRIELRVIDHGIGIPPAELPRIFEPFFRGSNISEGAGLGVGLTIAHAAIEAHGGTIRVESELHKGTTFTISLPV